MLFNDSLHKLVRTHTCESGVKINFTVNSCQNVTHLLPHHVCTKMCKNDLEFRVLFYHVQRPLRCGVDKVRGNAVIARMEYNRQVGSFNGVYLVHALIIYHKALIIRVKLYAVKSKLLYVGYLLLIVLSVRVYSTEAYKSSAVLLGTPIVYNSLLSRFCCH